VKPFVDEFGLLGGGGGESFVDDLHADGVTFAPGSFLVGVDPVHDHGGFSVLKSSDTFLGDFNADRVGSTSLSGDREAVLDGVSGSFGPVPGFTGILLDVIPDVQVHEGRLTEPFVDEYGLFSGGISNTVVDKVHAEGVVLAPGGVFVGVNPSHDEGSLTVLENGGTLVSDIKADGVASTPLSGNHEVVSNFLDVSFDGIPKVQVLKEGSSGVFWVEPVADGLFLSFSGVDEGLVDGFHADIVSSAPLSPLSFFQPLFDDKNINVVVDVDTI